uniref:Uncharacterized protein n=1 Tax=uncultured marine group II/III euryarchaeote AD1000_19_F05 TaxID=1457732 RepID=A0A075FL66_9EURY|nr:hypothetical protein [uncultured marine group II/III euryarchaeote AD1000_19_F05]
MAFLAGTLEQTSLILALIERGSGLRLMCSICSPIPAAMAGSESPRSVSSQSSLSSISRWDICGRPNPLPPESMDIPHGCFYSIIACVDGFNRGVKTGVSCVLRTKARRMALPSARIAR